jgi:transposase
VSSVTYRCAHCGNRTRFDVYERVRRRRYEHFDLGGESVTEEDEVLDRTVEKVVCRWCDRSDAIETAEQPSTST